MAPVCRLSKGGGESILSELVVIQIVVIPLSFQKLLVRAAFRDPAVLNDQNAICIADGG